jgi:hypothetical protein
VTTASAVAAVAAADVPAPASGEAPFSPRKSGTGLPNRSADVPRAERPETQSAEAPSESDDNRHGAKTDMPTPMPPETAALTRHTIRADGKTIDYNATAGNLLLRDKAGRATASVFYVAYSADKKDSADRPITFLFNGGPGTGSMFLLMGSIGPKRLRTASPAVTPPAQFPVRSTPHSISILRRTSRTRSRIVILSSITMR